MMDLIVTIDAGRLFAFIEAFEGKTVEEILAHGIASNARNMWLEKAGNTLRTSRQDYISGIRPVEIEGGKAIIRLEGSFPNLLEHGSAGFDMRETLLRSKGLTSRVIAFRHLLPGAIGAGGQPMGRPYEAALGPMRAKQLGKQIYQRASKLAPGARLSGGVGPVLHPHHSAPIYEGLTKLKTGPGARQNRYMTFRTISESVPEGWKYPPTMGKHLAQEVADELPRVIGKMVDQMVGALLEGIS